MDYRVKRPLGPWTLYWETSASTWAGLVNVHPNGEFLSSLALTILSIRMMYQCDELPGAKGLLLPGLSFSSFLGSEQRRRSSGGSIPDDQYKPMTIRSINLPLYLLSRAPSMNNRTFPRKALLNQSYKFFGTYCFLLSLVNPLFFMESWPTWAPIEQSEPTTLPKQQNWLSPALLAVHLAPHIPKVSFSFEFGFTES